MDTHFLIAQAHQMGVSVLRLTVWLVLLSVVFIPLERLFALRPRPRQGAGAVIGDLCFYFLSSLLPTLLLSIPVAALAYAAHALVPAGLGQAVALLPGWVRVIAALFISEIGFYWGHRWSHEIPLLWRFHAVHHSPEHIGWLVNTRAHPVDEVFTRLCGLVPLYVLGFAAPVGGSQSLLPMLVLFIATLWGFFIHANIRWRFGVLEWLVATPAFHHWHHTNDGPRYINKNFSSTLPIIDRIFRTHYLPDHSPARFGLDEPVEGNVAAQLAHPFRPARREALPTGEALTPEPG